jgi:hypothetical protein
LRAAVEVAISAKKEARNIGGPLGMGAAAQAVVARTA